MYGREENKTDAACFGAQFNKTCLPRRVKYLFTQGNKAQWATPQEENAAHKRNTTQQSLSMDR